ncbi:DUF4389 domain-containing protein [Umezawaea sp. Da 62-37]|uniref:DUF4389 domain-containing protein n=1 Tax=Umezawaea sp. Da 62-37 TaxID=3075927 RepID=UPI0028F70B93|nr:DUF4389 domain-containing protein [Umezawaea sp. Da 62-37]WNV84787.1 DUF4389 domain-containing protein [Umezawaea sp. Da 62-37]
MTSAAAPYPVHVRGRLDPGLNRWLWLVKWFLAIPHYVVLTFLWLGFSVVSLVALVAILITGRYPRPLFDFAVGVLRWTWRVSYYAYGALGTDRYPPFSLGEEPDYPATLEIPYPEHLSRGLVLVKWWLLAIPHYLVVGVFVGGSGYLAAQSDQWAWSFGGGLVGVFALIAGVMLLFTGRYPQGVFDFMLGMDRWVLRVAAYAGLLTDAYPPFRLDTGGDDPTTTRIGTDTTTPPASGPSDGHPGRIVAVVVGALLLLTGGGLLTGGAVAIWADQTQRDADGYLTTGTQTFHSDGYALEFQTVDLRWSDDNPITGEDVLGPIRIRTGDTPVFVGIARQQDVTTYLASVDHDVVATAVDTNGVHYDHRAGSAPAIAPDALRIWTASASGADRTVDWTPQPGQWTAVVMNADGSRPVTADLAIGATAPALGALTVGLVSGGCALVVLGIVVILLGAWRRPQQVPTTADPAAVA